MGFLGNQCGPAVPATPGELKAALSQRAANIKTVKQEYFTGPAKLSESGNLFNISGAGCMTSINLITSNAVFQYDGELLIYVDGAGSPSIRIPFGILAGYVNGSSLNSVSAAYVQSTLKYGNAVFRTPNFDVEYSAFNTSTLTASGGIRWNLRFPIPFGTSIRATLFNANATTDANDTSYWCIAEYTTEMTSNLRLKGYGNPAISTSTPATNTTVVTSSQTSDLMNVAGSGWIVGHWMIMDSFGTDSTGSTQWERDISLYRNGEGTASWQCSGFEDYFDSSFYWSGQVSQQSSGNAFLMMMRQSGGGNSARSASFKDILSTNGGFRFNNGGILKLEKDPDVGAGRLNTTSAFWSFSLYYQ